MCKVMVILGFLAVFVSCNNNVAPTSGNPHQTNLEKWQSNSTGNYSFYFTNICFCFGSYRGPYHIFVKNNSIDSIFNTYNNPTFPNSNPVIPDSQFSHFKTIDQEFAWVESGLASVHFWDTTYFDPVLGYPRYVYFDYEQMVADEEYGFRIDSVVIVR